MPGLKKRENVFSSYPGTIEPALQYVSIRTLDLRPCYLQPDSRLRLLTGF